MNSAFAKESVLGAVICYYWLRRSMYHVPGSTHGRHFAPPVVFIILYCYSITAVLVLPPLPFSAHPLPAPTANSHSAVHVCGSFIHVLCLVPSLSPHLHSSRNPHSAPCPPLFIFIFLQIFQIFQVWFLCLLWIFFKITCSLKTWRFLYSLKTEREGEEIEEMEKTKGDAT